MEARAKVTNVRGAPPKVRQVVDLIRGQSVDSADDILRFTKRPVAKIIQKLLKSAVANARDKDEAVDVDQLVVRTAMVDCGPIMKRWLPRARGRATPILKRSCHITIVVSDEK
jgi:large subunit ribosomal protein L22